MKKLYIGAFSFLYLFSGTLLSQTVERIYELIDKTHIVSVSVPKERDGIVFICDNTYAVVRSRDGGDSWLGVQSFPLQQYMPLANVFALNDTSFFAVGSAVGKVWFYKNYTNERLFAPFGKNDIPSIEVAKKTYFLDKDTGFIIGNYLDMGYQGAVLKTYNGGETWETKYDLQEGHEFNEITFLNDTLGFICGTSGGMLKTADRGDTWEQKSLFTDYDLMDICFQGKVGYAVGSKFKDRKYNSKIFKTTNMGASWTEYLIPVNVKLSSIDFKDPMEGYAVGAFGTIVKTMDGGKNWTKVESGVLDQLTDVAYTGKSWIITGENGVLLKISDVITSKEAKVAVNDLEIFPTIGSGFRVKAAADKMVSIEVMDYLGRVLFIKNNSVNEEEITLSSLPEGMYLIKISDGKNVVLKKFKKEN